MALSYVFLGLSLYLAQSPTPADSGAVVDAGAAPAAGAQALAPPFQADAWAAELPTLSDAERRARMEKLSREELAQLMKALPQAALVEMSKRAVQSLGSYRTHLRKEERINGAMMEPQIIDVFIREKPFALRAEFIVGPGKGRKAFYNEEIRKDEVRAKESGFLSIIGGTWLHLDSGLTRKETTHRLTDVGLGPLLRIVEADMKKGLTLGGHARKDEGFDAKGSYCLMFTSPNGGKGLYSQSTRLCIEPVTMWPTRAESWDAKGVFEKFEYTKVEQKKLGPKFFTPQAAGL